MQRRLGKNGPTVSGIGLGCIGISEFYGSIDLDECRRTLGRALELGCNFFDTAAMYGSGKNEEFLGEILADVSRESYVLATKCGIRRSAEDPMKRIIDNSAAHIKESCEESLASLKMGYIDVYYLHRIAGHGEYIEESMQAMAELLAKKKIRYVGLSEVNSEVIEKANRARANCKTPPSSGFCNLKMASIQGVTPLFLVQLGRLGPFLSKNGYLRAA